MGLNQSPFRVLFHLDFAINKSNESSPSLHFCAQHILIRVKNIHREGERKTRKSKRERKEVIKIST